MDQTERAMVIVADDMSAPVEATRNTSTEKEYVAQRAFKAANYTIQTALSAKSGIYTAIKSLKSTVSLGKGMSRLATHVYWLNQHSTSLSSILGEFSLLADKATAIKEAVDKEPVKPNQHCEQLSSITGEVQMLIHTIQEHSAGISGQIDAAIHEINSCTTELDAALERAEENYRLVCQLRGILNTILDTTEMTSVNIDEVLCATDCDDSCTGSGSFQLITAPDGLSPC